VVDALGWTGPIQVEFMWTPDDEFALIEVNGRYWGSTPLAVASGVDIPAVHYALLTGATPRPSTGYRDDVVQQRLLYGDLKWLDEQLADGNRWALVPFAAALVSADQVFVSVDDPGPTIAAVRQAASLAGEGIAGAVRDRLTRS
jgi:predicted ATP-grasp superfamily ATP-dependent carboligase